MTAAILSGHRRIPPYGMAGADPGKTGHNRVERAAGGTIELCGADRAELDRGDIFVIETPGVEDTTIEQLAINGKCDIFQEIYGYEPELRAA